MELQPYEALGGDESGKQILRAMLADYGLAGVTFNGEAGNWPFRACWTAMSKGVAGAIAQHQPEWREELDRVSGTANPWPAPPVRPFPQAPSRDQVLTATIGFQGLTAHTRQYGEFPMFGPETTTLEDDDLDAYCADIRAQGFTGGEIAVSWFYNEPGFLMPVPGRDLSNDLPELTRRVARMLREGGLTTVGVFLAGDGRSKPKNHDGSYPYNDPVGHTYGYEWLMDNLDRILRAFVESPDGDLTPYVIFSPTYDGGFMDGWGDGPGQADRQPQRVIDFGRKFRSLCPNGYLAIEHTPGNIPVGSGAGDWTTGGPLDAYDLLLSEYRDPITGGAPPGGQVWQVDARTVPHYTPPPDQLAAAADPRSPYHAAAVDPHPVNYLAPTTRGPRYKWAYEYATYPWTRGRRSLDQINQDRAYFRALGCTLVC